VESQTSGFHVAELRFGDFNADGVTDVFGITSNAWQVSYGATSSWTPLPVSLTTSIDNLLVADFDGDGRADVAKVTDVSTSAGGFPVDTIFVNNFTFAISHGAQAGWSNHTVTPTADCSLTFSLQQLQRSGLLAGIAKFDDAPGSDLLLWGAKDGNNFCVISSGTGPAQRHSSQDMR
jgi:hypothetical protein